MFKTDDPGTDDALEILRFVADLPSELHSRFEEYFITFNRQQGIGGTNHIQLILNQPIPSPIEPPRRDDAKFLGYFDHTDSPSAKRYYNADGTRAYGEPWEMRNGITLYARWEPYPILTFDWNFGNAPETEDRRTNERGFLIGSPPIVNDNMNPGHTFNGWFRTQVGGNPIDFSTHTFNRDTTLYAQWEPIPGWCDHDYNGFGVCKRSMSCGHIDGVAREKLPTPFHFMFRGGDETFANRISPPGDWLAYAGHRAIDIIHSVGGRINGLPIYSVSDGRVLRASTWENYGETVYVQSENHRLLYAHLQVGSYEVVLGQFITTANKLGKAGNSPGYYVVRDEKGNVIYDEDGNAVTAYMSPHLHFEVRNKDGTDRLNPRHFFPEKVFD